MSTPPPVTLIDVLSEPASLTRLTPGEQTLILRQARQTGLLGFLAVRIDLTPTAGKLADHLLGAKVHADYHDRMISWETNRLARVLASLDGPVVLLKGAAYKALQLDLAQGRLATDVDILLPRAQLPEAEALLLASGWEHMKRDEYEQHYYREWSHELPPLRHRERGTVVDLHHNILPTTARLKPQARKLIQSSQPMRDSRLHTLCPEDTILHRAAHLFFDGDLQNGLRELLDIHELITTYKVDEELWSRLVDRARELDLARPLYYALHFCEVLFHSGVPLQVQQASSRDAPPYLVRLFMQRLILKLLQPTDPDAHEPLRYLAGWLMFVRSHWLRMPPLLLARHLLTQTWRRGGVKIGAG